MSGSTIIRRTVCGATLLLLAMPRAGSAAEGTPVDNIRSVWPALSRCWTPPQGSGGMEATVRFSIKRTGELIGKPRVTYSKLRGDADEKRRFRDSVLAAVRDCTPLPITERLGAIIAGKPLTVRFVAPEDP